MNQVPTREQAQAELAALRRLVWIQAGLIVTKDGKKDYSRLRAATGDEETTGLWPNQEAAILGFSRLQAFEKCRQIGHSWALSADSLARAVLEPNSTSVHISTNYKESQSKNRYVLRLHDSLAPAIRSEISFDTKSEDRLTVRTKKGVSTIHFIAQTDPRGVERGGIYLHEMAHMEHLVAILKGARSSTLHGGFVKGCSTHEGAQSEFFRIMRNLPIEETGEYPYRQWETKSFPWWKCPKFCHDLERAHDEAPKMETEERVEMFGTWRIKDELANGSIADFREECECEVVDEKYSYFPVDLVNSCVRPEIVFDKYEANGKKHSDLKAVLEKIDWLADEIRARRVIGEWGWGEDVGRYQNPDVLTIGHATQKDSQNIEPNLILLMRDFEWEWKREVISHMMRVIPITRGAQDATGMGMELGEWAVKEFGGRATAVRFTSEIKSRLVNDLKIRMERKDPEGNRRMSLPDYGKLRRQFGSIRKKVLPSGGFTYHSESDGEDHADIFWSVALFHSNFELQQGNYAFTPTVGKRPGRTWEGTQIWTPGR